MTIAEKVQSIYLGLQKAYPNAACTLDYHTPLELLVATVLAAQCTDARVNRVTPDLFAKYRTAADYARAQVQELEELIKSTGFYRNKARNLIACCAALLAKHGGEVPHSMEDLISLPGIGRKTANVILGNAFNVPGIVVDTHAGRISRRLGLTRNSDPVKIEFDLRDIIPEKEWVPFGHRLVEHGRKVCLARKPRCGECFLAGCCDFYAGQDAGD